MTQFLGMTLFIVLAILASVLGMSLATSFILWDWQWFFESNTGWRIFVLLLVCGSAR